MRIKLNHFDSNDIPMLAFGIDFFVGEETSDAHQKVELGKNQLFMK